MSARRIGFTLIEIVVVLSILGMVTAVTLPAMMRSGPSDEARSAGAVAGVLQAARKAALERATSVTMTLVPATRAYLVQADSGDRYATLAQGVLALTPGTRLADARPSIRFTFSRASTADPDSVAVIGEGMAMVLVDRWTGEIRVRTSGR